MTNSSPIIVAIILKIRENMHRCDFINIGEYMKTKLCIFLLVAVCIICGCSRHEWKEFSSAKGKFSVLMPGDPQEQHQVVNTAVGPIDLYMYTIDSGSIAYIVGYSDYPEDFIKNSEPKKILDGAREGAVRNIKGTLVASREITLEGHPGMEFAFDVPKRPEFPYDGIGRSHMFLVGNRLYQCMVIGKKSSSVEEVTKFVDSFRLSK